jgi:ribosomal protein L35
MAKQKTHKALASRIKITKTGKVLKRYAGQDHFNSRDTGKMSRKKRRDVLLSSTHRKAIKTLIPNTPNF